MWLDSRGRNPSIPLKAAMGLLGLALGFLVIAWGAANASPDNLVSPSWLVVMYFLHTVGELCISPIGLSAITKLSPARRVGQMMGVWFVGAALGNLFAGLVAGGLADMEASALFPHRHHGSRWSRHRGRSSPRLGSGGSWEGTCRP